MTVNYKNTTINNYQPEFNRKSRWVHGKVIIAPKANEALLTFQCTHGIKTFVHGFKISSFDIEGNAFVLEWVHNGVKMDFPPDIFASYGTVYMTDYTTAINEEMHADPQSVITIKCLQDASAGSKYRVSMLIAEEVL